MGTDPAGGWDFFVSYTQLDRAWAEWIAWVLEEDQHRVLVQAWDSVPGTNWIQGMQAGALDAARTIAVLSDAYLQSVYGSAEWQAAWAADPEGSGRKLLTVRVTDCARPGLLAGVTSLDLFGLDEAAARASLREMVMAALSGRRKPAVPPAFPGGSARAVPEEPEYPGRLPRVWQVAPHNPNFIGRGQELHYLARALATDTAVTVQAVHGMGGVGKTQLAIEYAHAHAREYEVVWQIAAEEPAAIPDQFTALATKLGLEPANDPEALQAQVYGRLRATAGWLLIYDNADAVADIQHWLPDGPAPAGARGHVIVTTRRSGFSVFGPVLDLDVIGLSDAVRLLRSRAPRLSRAEGRQIANELGRLPLALEQAAAYLDRSDMPPAEYLALLRGRAIDLYRRGKVSSRKDTIATLWDLSLERISHENPAAVQLLEVCAYLAPEPIPLDLFTAHPDSLPEPLSSAAGDEIGFADTIAVLADYSLIKRSSAGLLVHRLVQGAIRAHHNHGSPSPARHNESEQKSGPATSPLLTALVLLQAAAPADIISVPSAWPIWAALLPHVLTAAERVNEATGMPERDLLPKTSWLLDRAGIYLQVHARLGDARKALEGAVSLNEAIYGPDHSEVAAVQNNLAAVLRDLGRPADARSLQERALAIEERTYGPSHPNVARALNNLAWILRALDQSAAAEPLQRRALAIWETEFGPRHTLVATALDNLAQILRTLGRPAEARPLQQRAMDIYEESYDSGHPDIARALNNLALILRDLDELEAALPLQERALVIDEDIYGPNHPLVATALNNLAQILRDLDEPAAARPLQERALAIDEAAYGPRHPTVAIRLINLALILRDLGQPTAAGRLEERARKITRTG